MTNNSKLRVKITLNTYDEVINKFVKHDGLNMTTTSLVQTLHKMYANNVKIEPQHHHSIYVENTENNIVVTDTAWTVKAFIEAFKDTSELCYLQEYICLNPYIKNGYIHMVFNIPKENNNEISVITDKNILNINRYAIPIYDLSKFIKINF